MEFLRDSNGISLMVGVFSDILGGTYTARYRTNCCALGQLALNNGDTVEEINKMIEYIKDESKLPINQQQREGAERAIFVVTIPEDESILERRLEKAGFKMIYEFHSRAYNPETRMLRMWIISW